VSGKDGRAKDEKLLVKEKIQLILQTIDPGERQLLLQSLVKSSSVKHKK
jgi:hypothetical protein